jgi:hypothetical protein
MTAPSASTGPGSDQPATEQASPEAGTSTESTASADTPEAGESEADTPVFTNRAARRARAKGSVPQRVQGTTGQFGRKGTIQSPRQWGNRRSG